MLLLVRIWKVVRWILLALLLLLIGSFVFYFIPRGAEKVKTDEAVTRIHATKLTWNDVFGPLPPAPDPTQNNATLAGIDANNNGIRDDVEIAIYNAHKDSAKVAAAEFQYAKELQMEFTDVFNSPTLVAVLQEEDRGYGCMFNLSSSTDLKTLNKLVDARTKEVENLVFNTQTRKDAEENILEKYMTGYALPNSNFCDLDPTILPN